MAAGRNAEMITAATAYYQPLQPKRGECVYRPQRRQAQHGSYTPEVDSRPPRLTGLWLGLPLQASENPSGIRQNDMLFNALDHLSNMGLRCRTVRMFYIMVDIALGG